MSQAATYCKRHPSFETSVSCGRCGDPICPRCLVHAPVGVRCPDCGRSKPAPTFDVSPIFLARGAGAGIAVALLGAAVIVLAILLTPQTAPRLLMAIPALLIGALGYAIGEAISLATNRKRGTKLKVTACLCMLLAFTLITIMTGAGFATIYLLAGAVGFYLAITKF